MKLNVSLENNVLTIADEAGLLMGKSVKLEPFYNLLCLAPLDQLAENLNSMNNALTGIDKILNDYQDKYGNDPIFGDTSMDLSRQLASTLKECKV